jgi:hypothetical protein
MIYPRRETLGQIDAGGPGLRVQLGPYETLFLETAAATDESVPAVEYSNPNVTLAASQPKIVTAAVGRGTTESNPHWTWNGAVSLPEASGAELCVVLEGSREVSGTGCKLSINGRDVEVRRSTSVGQFGAAIDASPENWMWFVAALPAGDNVVQIDLTLIAEEESIGVFVRGAVPAQNDPAPESGAVFPTFHAERRPWSQTLLPLRDYSTSSR